MGTKPVARKHNTCYYLGCALIKNKVCYDFLLIKLHRIGAG